MSPHYPNQVAAVFINAHATAGISNQIDDALDHCPPGAHVAIACNTTQIADAGLALRLAGLEIRDTIRVVTPAGEHDKIVVLSRVPLAEKSVALNVLEYGLGAMNIDACRVPFLSEADKFEATDKNRHSDFATPSYEGPIYGDYSNTPRRNYDSDGRFPTNLLLIHHSDCDDTGCIEVCPAVMMDDESGLTRSRKGRVRGASTKRTAKGGLAMNSTGSEYSDSGGASRFFPRLAAEPSHGGIPSSVIAWVRDLLVPDGMTMPIIEAGRPASAHA